MPETDQTNKTSHAGVKGEFVGKQVPPDGIQMRIGQAGSNNMKKGTRPDGSRRSAAGSGMNQQIGTY